MTRNLIVEELNNPKIVSAAKNFPNEGIIKLSQDNLLYLDIDDRFINELCPLFDSSKIVKPDYFSIGIGAHISIIYPNEISSPIYDESDIKYHFEIDTLFKASTEDKTYYALSIVAPELLKIRNLNGLHSDLNLDGYLVEMHTTIAVSEN